MMEDINGCNTLAIAYYDFILGFIQKLNESFKYTLSQENHLEGEVRENIDSVYKKSLELTELYINLRQKQMEHISEKGTINQDLENQLTKIWQEFESNIRH
ncbi:hypothetical protein KY366_08700 [Candidatus Woesearchaeota archaeon]|nr:hypothetical protein [Candidatus Woesearchaeota archaeon]